MGKKTQNDITEIAEAIQFFKESQKQAPANNQIVAASLTRLVEGLKEDLFAAASRKCEKQNNGPTQAKKQ